MKRKFLTSIFILLSLFAGAIPAFSGGWVEQSAVASPAADDQWGAFSRAFQSPASDGALEMKFVPRSNSVGASITATNLPNGSTAVDASLTIYAYGKGGSPATMNRAKIATITVPPDGKIYKCTDCYGFIGVSHDSVSIATTGTGPGMVTYYWRE